MLQSLLLLLYSLFRCFVIIPSSRNTCHASSSLFVICCFTSSCPDRRDRTVDFGLKKTVRHCTGLSEKLTYFDLCFDFPPACDSYFKTFNKFYHRKQHVRSVLYILFQLADLRTAINMINGQPITLFLSCKVLFTLHVLIGIFSGNPLFIAARCRFTFTYSTVPVGGTCRSFTMLQKELFVRGSPFQIRAICYAVQDLCTHVGLPFTCCKKTTSKAKQRTWKIGIRESGATLGLTWGFGGYL